MKHVLLISFALLSIVCHAQKYRSEYIRYSTYIELTADKKTRTDSVILQINERMGDHDATILIPYSKGDKISIGDVWIEDMEGNIVRKLKNNEITDQSYLQNMTFYNDMYIKSFEMKHNSYPYCIVYSYKKTYSKFLEAYSFDGTYLANPIRAGKLVVEAPADQPLKYKKRNIGDPDTVYIPKKVLYTWTYDYIPESRQINSSENASEAPQLTVLPATFRFGERGSWDSWQTFGNWIWRLNKNKDDLPEIEKIKINKLIEGVADDKEKAKILYHYLQDNNRYINVSVKTGGLESYPASYVCTNRYGDCKALSNYMKSILNHAGIKSYYTLVYSDDRVIDIDSDFPSQAFNHVIVTIPFEGDTTYLECTSQNLPFGYIHSSIQGRKALMIDETDSRFTEIPSLRTEDVLCERKFDISTNVNGYASMTIKVIHRGHLYESSNNLAANKNRNSVDKYIRNTILQGSYELSDFRFLQKDRDDKAIALEIDCKIPNMVKKYGNNTLITLFPIDIPIYETPDLRNQSVQLDYPEYYKDTMVYEFPEQTISKMPENINVNSDYGQYSLSFETKGNKLIVYKEILILAGRYSPAEYKGFYDFITSIRNYENKKMNIETL